MFSNPIAAYTQMDRESDIRGSSPYRLIVLLFDGALAAIAEAEECIQQRDIPGKAAAIGKAIDIINDGLCASLNLEAGGELADNLKALYLYMVTRLAQANAAHEPAALNEVRDLLQTIGDAWREMGEQLQNTGNNSR